MSELAGFTSSGTGGSVSAVRFRKSKAALHKLRPLPKYHVILLNDDDHSYDYVIEMLRVLFGYTDTKGMRLAETVDTEGRSIVITTHREHAELKRDQIHAYGTDHRIARCAGSMSARLEPAED